MTAKVAVFGALGRMGQMIMKGLLEKPEASLSAAIERPGCPALGHDVGPSLGAGNLGVTLLDDPRQGLEAANVYIDFSSLEASLNHLETAVSMGVAAVIGVTGYSADDQAKLQAAAQKIPVLWAPNMSIGVNVMYKVAALMTKILGPDFDPEIVELHHNQKKDAPSGTAVKLYETVAEAAGLNVPDSMVTGRTGQVGARTKKEIGVLAVRGGDIVGEHTVYFCGTGERLELTHRASSRAVFAQGAIRAALWLYQQKPGLYNMNDVLGL